MVDPTLTDEQLQEVYTWIDKIPLSRPKRNMGRDFSDGVLFAEVIHHYHPKLLDLHNYVTANSLSQKTYNWETLNQKVFRKLKFSVSPNDIDGIVNCKSGAVEMVLYKLRSKLAGYQPGARRTEPKLAKSTISSSTPRTYQPQKSESNNMKATFNRNLSQPPVNYEASSFENDEDAQVFDRFERQENNFGMGNTTTMHRNDLDSNPPHISKISQNVQVLLHEKDQTIVELRDTISILELKIKRLEQLVQLKDSKIAAMQKR